MPKKKEKSESLGKKLSNFSIDENLRRFFPETSKMGTNVPSAWTREDGVSIKKPLKRKSSVSYS